MELRVAVTTGEALVTDGVRVAGDPVATCARLQQAAPSGTVLVSEATGRATERSISYGPASLLALAGRARPMTVWSALEPRNRTGMDGLAAGPVPLIGRDRELGQLLEAFRRARDGRRPQLVTLLGPPGIGKSRWWPSSAGPWTPTTTWSAGARAAPRPGTGAAPPPPAASPTGPWPRSSRPRPAPGDRLGRPGRAAPVPGRGPRHGRRAGRDRPGHLAPAGGWSARATAPRSRRAAATRRSPPGGASCTGWPTGGPWSWCWRTCTGPTTPCSTSSRSCWSRPGRRPWAGTGGRCAPGPRRRPPC